MNSEWKLEMLRGFIIIVLGLLLLFATETAILLMALILGLYLLVEGVSIIIGAIKNFSNTFALDMIKGGLALFFGIGAIIHPVILIGMISIPIFEIIGTVLIFLGVLAILFKKVMGGKKLLKNVAMILIGIFLLMKPLEIIEAFGFIVGGILVFIGIILILNGFLNRHEQ